jgi:hypothetical protein
MGGELLPPINNRVTVCTTGYNDFYNLTIYGSVEGAKLNSRTYFFSFRFDPHLRKMEKPVGKMDAKLICNTLLYKMFLSFFDWFSPILASKMAKRVGMAYKKIAFQISIWFFQNQRKRYRQKVYAT